MNQKTLKLDSLKSLKREFNQILDTLVAYSGLPRQLVTNIYLYVISLRCPDGGIDDKIFYAQMSQRFAVTNSFMLNFIFDAIKTPKTQTLSIENMCKLLCLFLSDDTDKKCEFVFSVYDFNGDGVLNTYDFHALLKPCFYDQDADEAEESFKEIMEILNTTLDLEAHDGILDKAFFKQKVFEDDAYLDILGQCIPSSHKLQEFREDIETKSQSEIRMQFKDERTRSLQEPVFKNPDALYPIPIILP